MCKEEIALRFPVRRGREVCLGDCAKVESIVQVLLPLVYVWKGVGQEGGRRGGGDVVVVMVWWWWWCRVKR